MNDWDESLADELRAEDRARRRLAAAFSAHPDPRDPDYPIQMEDEDEQEVETDTEVEG